MIISIDKLVSYDQNRYIMTRAAMTVVDNIEAVTDMMIEGEEWRIVPNVLRLILDGKVKFELLEK